jgi:hypothetical protein
LPYRTRRQTRQLTSSIQALTHARNLIQLTEKTTLLTIPLPILQLTQNPLSTRNITLYSSTVIIVRILILTLGKRPQTPLPRRKTATSTTSTSTPPSTLYVPVRARYLTRRIQKRVRTLQYVRTLQTTGTQSTPRT